VHYNQPSGNLFGEKPLPVGQKRKWEDWESIWYFGFFGSIVFGGIMRMYRPDTSIETWAKKEADKALQEEGKVPAFTPSETA